MTLKQATIEERAAAWRLGLRCSGARGCQEPIVEITSPFDGRAFCAEHGGEGEALALTLRDVLRRERWRGVALEKIPETVTAALVARGREPADPEVLERVLDRLLYEDRVVTLIGARAVDRIFDETRFDEPTAYVAGSSGERDRCREAARLFTKRGFCIAFAWYDEPDVPEASLASSERRRLRALCLHAAETASAFLFCIPTAGRTTVGAWFELATRLRGEPERRYTGATAASGSGPLVSLFAEDLARYPTDEEAVAELAAWIGLTKEAS